MDGIGHWKSASKKTKKHQGISRFTSLPGHMKFHQPGQLKSHLSIAWCFIPDFQTHHEVETFQPNLDIYDVCDFCDFQKLKLSNIYDS